MTFSLLVRDPGSGALGGAAATGSLCVGGWVLRGDSRAGISASQGAAPSTLWGEDVLDLMRAGTDPQRSLARITGADSGRDWRQIAALDRSGRNAVFTGDRNTGWHGSLRGEGFVAAGNMLCGAAVLEAAVEAFNSTPGALSERLLAGLRAGEDAGGDTRGLQSAALLVVADDQPPLTLRVDWAEAPLEALETLHARTRDPAYADWLPRVPTRRDPERADVE